MNRLLLREEISYSAARDKEANILHRLGYFEKESRFIAELAGRDRWIKDLVAHHLNINPSRCDIAATSGWFRGSFNLCIPVTIRDWKREQPGDRVILRLPLPYKCGEEFRPGNTDEKIRCEVATYVWLQENHPNIPIPRLYGFSLSSGESFTRIDSLPFFTRCYRRICYLISSWIGGLIWPKSTFLSQYVRHQNFIAPTANFGYILIEYIEINQGTMLSDTWFKHSTNTALRATLFRSLARIMLSFYRIPLPHIGSFTIDNNGLISLSNRPLTLEIQELENEEIPIDIQRHYTYSTTDSYITDIVGIHDSRLIHQPNAINNPSDYINQVTTLTGMRISIPLFFRRDLRRGPFIFSLTDLHQSNLFVDKEWNITSLVDLEWGCSLPVEMIHPPRWLTCQFDDGIDEKEYEKLWTEFVQILAQEEDGYLITARQELRLSSIMTKGWEMGTFWYSLALQNIVAIFNIFQKRIQKRLGKDTYDAEQYCLIMVYHWSLNPLGILNQKVADRTEYDNKLREAFGIPPQPES
ncbi:hypothetical protein MGYG_01027 [Nannizzia gypsea CBS 118893]|uniref:Aminoglycoside phosphotransferase domain-containing protein n=1 Tax=Arthroderma gypseum (strain ATCC MYA-4604 / CBS 118893) TaxID=535722 RepID=E5R3T1_ARTGP|nr:hypothetical protein MGYG_01027 [Nannizzia gypsea CBS 118893]EFQ97991.1 hypothetical protein MGYG_01027 [Nannizzia gypsea CBS 118893]